MKVKENKVGNIYIRKTKSNMFVCLKTLGDRLLLSSSGGTIMSGRDRSSKLAGEQLGFKVGKEAKLLGYSKVNLIIKGPIKYNIEGVLGGLREAGIMFQEMNLKLVKAHNGVRARKQKRK